MRNHTILLLCALLASPAVFAQSPPSTDTNHDTRLVTPAMAASTAASPSVSSSVSPVVQEHRSFHADTKPSAFKFKDQKRHSGVTDRPPPNANDKAAVMGTQRPWQNGHAPVDCAISPHADGCR